MSRLTRLAALALAFGALLLLPGCAVLQPWEKGTISRDDMTWAPDPLQARLDVAQRAVWECDYPLAIDYLRKITDDEPG